MIDLVPFSERGRHFSVERRVHLSDTSPSAVLRPDGLARYLQDVASDDTDDVGVTWLETWVVRRTTLRVVDGGRWPTLGESVTLTTWCSGVGAAWAERRTDVLIGSTLAIEAAGLWVPLDQAGFPHRLRPEFYEIYADAFAGRKVSGRVSLTPVDPDAVRRPWPLRRADLDIVGHVNNAAIWSALSEVAPDHVRSATVTHHGPLEGSDTITLAYDERRLWLLVGDGVRVSGDFDRG